MGKTALPPELLALLDRLAHRRGELLELAGDELRGWPEAFRVALVDQGLILRMAPAEGVICPGCEEACAVPVQWRTSPGGGASLAFIACAQRPDMGRVPLAPWQLERWKLAPGTIGDVLARLLGQPAALRLDAGFRLGWIDGEAGRLPVVLVADADGVGLAVGGHRLPLSQVLTWSGERLGLDVAVLRRHARVGGGDAVTEAPLARARRLQARKAELVRAGEKRFLKVIAAEEGLSESRIKQVLARKLDLVPADPFAGLGATVVTGRTASRSGKGQRRR